MNVVVTILLAAQMLAALGMIGLILIQHGKGADMGAAFGSGASGSLFGASGSANFLSRTTAILAAVFFVCTLGLAYFSNVHPAASSSGSVLDGAVPVTAPAAPNSPVAPVAPATPAAPDAAAQIPATSAPAAAPATAPAVPATGAAQIPGK